VHPERVARRGLPYGPLDSGRILFA